MMFMVVFVMGLMSVVLFARLLLRAVLIERSRDERAYLTVIRMFSFLVFSSVQLFYFNPIFYFNSNFDYFVVCGLGICS